jgi:hypothetical protein
MVGGGGVFNLGVRSSQDPGKEISNLSGCLNRPQIATVMRNAF